MDDEYTEHMVPDPLDTLNDEQRTVGMSASPDFEFERMARSGASRYLFLGAGFTCVGIGALGLVLPGLPGTPLLLLAAACFARSSPRFHNWLLDHQVFGEVIRNWHEERSIPLRAKVLAITFIALSGSLSVYLAPLMWVRLLIAAILVSVCVWLLRQKTAGS